MLADRRGDPRKAGGPLTAVATAIHPRAVGWPAWSKRQSSYNSNSAAQYRGMLDD